MFLLAAIGISMMINLSSLSWLIVNDDVMGGRSQASATLNEDGLLFRGTVSLENNGGFASTRGLLQRPPTGATKVRINVRGDGRSYQIRLRPARSYDGVAWRQEFQTNGKWQTLVFDLSNFEPVFRGRLVRDAGAIDPETLGQVGFMIADKKAGPFSLEVREMSFIQPES